MAAAKVYGCVSIRRMSTRIRSKPRRTSTRACTSTYSTAPVGSAAGFGWRIVRTKAAARCRAASICPTDASGSCSRGRNAETNDAFDGGGMSFDVVEPFKRLTVRYRGKLCLMENPKDMADPAYAFKNNPVIPAEIDLDYEGVSPMFGGEPVNADGSKIEQKAEESFARGHYEQHMVGAERSRSMARTFTIDGLGLRDHSWGPRYWQAIHWYRWLPMNFSRDFAMMVSITCAPQRRAPQRRHGAAQRRIRDDPRRADRVEVRRRSVPDRVQRLGEDRRTRIYRRRQGDVVDPAAQSPQDAGRRRAADAHHGGDDRIHVRRPGRLRACPNTSIRSSTACRSASRWGADRGVELRRHSRRGRRRRSRGAAVPRFTTANSSRGATSTAARTISRAVSSIVTRRRRTRSRSTCAIVRRTSRRSVRASRRG